MPVNYRSDGPARFAQNQAAHTEQFFMFISWVECPASKPEAACGRKRTCRTPALMSAFRSEAYAVFRRPCRLVTRSGHAISVPILHSVRHALAS